MGGWVGRVASVKILNLETTVPATNTYADVKIHMQRQIALRFTPILLIFPFNNIKGLSVAVESGCFICKILQIP